MSAVKRALLLFLIAAVLISAMVAAEDEVVKVIAPPPAGKIYHGAFPADTRYWDEVVIPEALDEYEQVVRKRVAIVYFSHNWYRGREFPLETAKWIKDRGAVPFIRLMLRSNPRQNRAERKYSLEKIIAGNFDENFRRWARGAREYAWPLLVEYGTEFNGRWFSWNGWWHGKGMRDSFGNPQKYDGPERFVAAYRHIVDVVRAEGAGNITWVWHPNAGDWPQKDWNRFENYYPGDDYVDWIAVSAYGPQQPTEDWGETFREMIDPWHARAIALAPGKPIYIAEFGCTHTSLAADENPEMRADNWAHAALQDIFSGRWPAVIGFTWWNEAWQNDNNPAHDTNMRIQDWKPLKKAFKRKLRSNQKKLQTKPRFVHR